MGVDGLADVAEAGVVERHVAQPDGRKAGLVDELRHLFMLDEGRAGGVRISLQRRDETKGQLAGREGPGEAAMVLKVDGQRTQLRGVKHQVSVSVQAL
jgi:hypothetical protein